MNAEDTLPVATETKPDVNKLILREALSWLWVILAFLFITGTIVQARVIPSGSMENTLLIGDHLIMSRIGYDAGIPFTDVHVPLWRNPKRQQIVIFKPPFAPDQPDYVKRVIGLPGDKLESGIGEATSSDAASTSRTSFNPSFNANPAGSNCSFAIMRP